MTGNGPTSLNNHQNFEDTWFRDDAAKSFNDLFGDAALPFKHNTSASWIPEQSLNFFNSSVTPNGNWILTVQNLYGSAAATLNSWEIEFRDTPNGNRTTSVWVTNSEAGYPAYDNCATPKRLDKYHNYYGRTKTTYLCNTTTDPPISATVGTPWTVAGPNRTNTTLDNTIWFSFKTDAVGGNVDVLISYISKAGTGYQATVVDPGAAPCVAANWTIVAGSAYVQNNAFAGGGPTPIAGATVGNAITYNSVIKCTGLAPSKVYYVCVDGTGNSLGTNCAGGTPSSDIEFQIEATGALLSNYSSLPVQLTSFTADCNYSKVNINWKVATQTNNDFFTIERSVDGSRFENIGAVKGAGNTSQEMNYSFTDTDPIAETTYYRLKQTDYNGHSETFTPTAVACGDDIPFSVKVNPNPVTGNTICLNINGAENENVTILLSDITGRQLYSNTFSENTNSYIEVIRPGKELTEGIYFIAATMKDNFISRKIIIQ